jgi:hypothetical protein
VGAAHPTIRNFRNIRLKSTKPKNPPEADKFQRAVALLACVVNLAKLACPVFFLKLTEYSIRCWAFNAYSPPPVGSMFIFLIFLHKINLALMGINRRPYDGVPAQLGRDKPPPLRLRYGAFGRG